MELDLENKIGTVNFERDFHNLKNNIQIIDLLMLDGYCPSQELENHYHNLTKDSIEYYNNLRAKENMSLKEHKRLMNEFYKLADMLEDEFGENEHVEIFKDQLEKTYGTGKYKTDNALVSKIKEYLRPKNDEIEDRLENMEGYMKPSEDELNTIMNNIMENLRRYGKDAKIYGDKEENFYRIKIRNKINDKPDKCMSTGLGNKHIRDILYEHGGEAKFYEGTRYYATLLRFPLQ